MAAKIHPSAHVSEHAELGEGVSIWQNAQVREKTKIGARTIVGMGTYIDAGVQVGADCKFQNYVCTYAGLTIEDGVFCGPCVVFTNDLNPRAIRPDGGIKSSTDWVLTETRIRYGAALGANSTIVCGITVGRWALVAAGSVVSRNVPDYGLVSGNPARVRAFVSPAGFKMAPLREPAEGDAAVSMKCPKSGDVFEIPMADYKLLRPRHA
jgi:UDP-2-acetamido-3-amino-2,3-dideoxy-glucuronate N-acetyltransferase